MSGSPSTLAPTTFSLIAGGPTYRLARALHLVRDDASGGRLALVLVIVTWLPLAVVGLLTRTEGLIRDYGVHARLLVAIPLLIAAERSLHVRTARCIERFTSGQWVKGGTAAVARITAAAIRRRDMVVPELVLLVLALIGSQLVARGGAESLGIVRGRHQEIWSPAVAWYALVSLPVYQFLVARWLWRWAIWSRLLWDLSRLRLNPIAMHPDRQGGLGFLCEPSVAFGYVICGVCAVQAGVWADQIMFMGAGLASFQGQFAIILVLAALLTFGPLCVFIPTMWRARFAAVRDYGRLATDYTRMFHARWIEHGERDSLLGTPDLQSLADLGNSFDVMRSMRVVPFGARSLTIIIGAVIIPMVPLLLLEIPLIDLLRKIFSVAAGGLPG